MIKYIKYIIKFKKVFIVTVTTTPTPPAWVDQENDQKYREQLTAKQTEIDPSSTQNVPQTAGDTANPAGKTPETKSTNWKTALAAGAAVVGTAGVASAVMGSSASAAPTPLQAPTETSAFSTAGNTTSSGGLADPNMIMSAPQNMLHSHDAQSASMPMQNMPVGASMPMQNTAIPNGAVMFDGEAEKMVGKLYNENLFDKPSGLSAPKSPMFNENTSYTLPTYSSIGVGSGQGISAPTNPPLVTSLTDNTGLMTPSLNGTGLSVPSGLTGLPMGNVTGRPLL